MRSRSSSGLWCGKRGSSVVGDMSSRGCRACSHVFELTQVKAGS